MKQAAIASARRVVAAADSGKFTRTAFGAVCPLDRLDLVVTDSAIPRPSTTPSPPPASPSAPSDPHQPPRTDLPAPTSPHRLPLTVRPPPSDRHRPTATVRPLSSGPRRVPPSSDLRHTAHAPYLRAPAPSTSPEPR
nr:hypothetical protein GCM10020093_023280 [Planobispora longispora]